MDEGARRKPPGPIAEGWIPHQVDFFPDLTLRTSFASANTIIITLYRSSLLILVMKLSQRQVWHVFNYNSDARVLPLDELIN